MSKAKQTDKLFKALRKATSSKAKELFVAIAIDAHESIKAGYASIKPVSDDSGKRLTVIPDDDLVKRVTEAVKLDINDEITAAVVYIDGEDEHNDALRWYAYGVDPVNVKNPFLAAYKRLANQSEINRIAGSLSENKSE